MIQFDVCRCGTGQLWRAESIVGSRGRRGLRHDVARLIAVCALVCLMFAAPVRAGDTLFSYTDVLEVDALGDAAVGAVRCRLVVLKNEVPTLETSLKPEGQTVPALDLDLWELIPKREAI